MNGSSSPAISPQSTRPFSLVFCWSLNNSGISVYSRVFCTRSSTSTIGALARCLSTSLSLLILLPHWTFTVDWPFLPCFLSEPGKVWYLRVPWSVLDTFQQLDSWCVCSSSHDVAIFTDPLCPPHLHSHPVFFPSLSIGIWLNPVSACTPECSEHVPLT